jgi:hypothetical protein
MSTIRGWTLGVVLAALTAVGCAHNSASVSAEPAAVAPRSAAMLVVQNEHFSDMAVFAVRDGDVSVRFGMVDAHSSTTFAIDQWLVSTGTFGLVAKPMGGVGLGFSGPLVVNAGQTVTFTVQPDIRVSMATVH